MTVTKVEPVSKTRSRVYVDEQPVFVLYKGELSRYQIREDEELDPEVYEEILNTVVLKRAKARALHLLNDMGRTEALLKKGIAKEEAEEALDEYYCQEDSGAAIKAILRKKKFEPETACRAEKQKMGGYLMRKGFRYEEICRIIQFYD